jgi:hypothetical protein
MAAAGAQRAPVVAHSARRECVRPMWRATGEDTAGEHEEADMTTATELGQTGLQGWRQKVANGISGPVARRAPLEED